MEESKFKKIDCYDIPSIMDYLEDVNKTIHLLVKNIAKNGEHECALIHSLQQKLNVLDDQLSTEKPYINNAYNPNYGDHRICKCGHEYYRHFDSYDDMSPCGCKYCSCYKFEEKVFGNWMDLSAEAKSVLEWIENIMTYEHDIMFIQIGEYFDRPTIRYAHDELKTHILITSALFNEIVAWCEIDQSIDILEKTDESCKFQLKSSVSLH